MATTLDHRRQPPHPRPDHHDRTDHGDRDYGDRDRADREPVVLADALSEVMAALGGPPARPAGTAPTQ